MLWTLITSEYSCIGVPAGRASHFGFWNPRYDHNSDRPSHIDCRINKSRRLFAELARSLLKLAPRIRYCCKRPLFGSISGARINDAGPMLVTPRVPDTFDGAG